MTLCRGALRRSPETRPWPSVALALALAFTGTPRLLAESPPPVFRITPLRPVEELRREALAATPPLEKGPFRPVDLVEPTALDPTIRLDVRYATADNFLSTPIYTEARALLQRPAAEALVRASAWLRTKGYGLLIHDAYRPWWVTKLFWEATPVDKREFVADPAKGSRHNRGCAVDLTLYSLADGRAVEMPSLYDEMSQRAYPGYRGGTPEQRARRDLLRRAMEAHGFKVFASEWWHFDYRDWRKYGIGTVTGGLGGRSPHNTRPPHRPRQETSRTRLYSVSLFRLVVASRCSVSLFRLVLFRPVVVVPLLRPRASPRHAPPPRGFSAAPAADYFPVSSSTSASAS